MPSISERLTYSVIGGIVLTALAALTTLVGVSTLAAALLALADAVAVYWLVGCSQTTFVRARETAAAASLLLLLCGLADLAAGYAAQAVLFLLAGIALGYVFVLLQQGAVPIELRLAGVLAVAAPLKINHLRMLEELRDAGILTADEFAAKRALAGR